jgi:pyruvate dehydrogenase E2 component (dihydrolipoamide acetyltransferase)
MSVPVTMPRLGESVTEGTVTRWLKKEGDRVEADEPLLEVSTDKVDTEIPAPATGVLASIRVGEDETVEVGTELALIDEGGQPGGDGQAPEQKSEPQPEPEPQAEPEPEPEPEPQQPQARPGPQPQQPAPDAEPLPEARSEQQPAGEALPRDAAAHPQEARAADVMPEDGGGAYVTPLVRRLAAERGVDLNLVRGTGVGGRIRKQDVLEAARGGGGAAPAAPPRPAPTPAMPAPPTRPAAPAAPAAAAPAGPATQPARGRTEKLSRLRQVIATRMAESLQTSAQLTTVVEADVTRIARLRDLAKTEFEAREGTKLTFLPFFALATCEALKEHPRVNASIDMQAGTVTYHDAVHLGIAVDTDRGLLVPVIRDAGDLNLAGLARKIADLAERTRGNRVSPDELSGGTFTLTNTGSRGALFDTPIINQPQVGILGTGAVVRRPAVVDDPDFGEMLAIRHLSYLALTYDHRLVDGADAARFLATVKARLEAGDFDAELGR